MKRIFQKHGKIIMAIMGVILMIVFALPTFTGQGADTSGVKVGTINGRKVTQGDLNEAKAEMDLVRDYLGAGDNFQAALGLDPNNPELHWFLKVKEATQFGFDSIPFTESYLDPDRTNMLMGRVPGLRKIDVVTAMKHYYMIGAMARFVLDFPVSIPALELAVDQADTRIQVSYATFDADQGWDAGEKFSDDEIKKQFELYKSVVHTVLPENATDARPPEPPEINGHHYPFGYKYPNRVKVEYLVFDKAAFIGQSGVTIDDQKAALAVFNKMKKADPKLEYTEDQRTKLESDQVADRVAAQMKSMTERAQTQLNEPWKNSDSVPADKWVKYEDVINELAPRPVDLRPERKSIDQWMSQEDLAKLPGIGKAYFQMAGRTEEGDKITFTFPELALHVKELTDPATTGPATGPATKPAPKEAIDHLNMQMGVEGRVLTDDQGNLYLFRVTGVDLSHEATLEEARPQVIEDLQKLDRLAKVQAAAKAFAEKARKGDFSALAAAETPPLKVVRTIDFSRTSQDNRDFQESRIRGLVKAAFSLVPPPSKVARPTTEPASTQAADVAATQAQGVGDTTTFVDESALRAYAVELASVRPVSAETYGRTVQMQEETGDTSLKMAAQRDSLAAFSQYFSLDSLKAREKYLADP